MDKNFDHNLRDEDLEKAAPLLFSIKKNMDRNAGFQVPESYFESLPSEVMQRIESVREFETAEPVNPFKAPEGYFDALPAIIQQRISEQNKKKHPVYGWISETFRHPVPKYSLAFVSVFLILFFSIKYFSRTQKVNYVNAEHETEQLESFYLSQLDETVLSEAYAEEQGSANDIQENEIEDYLLENNIDLNLISENL